MTEIPKPELRADVTGEESPDSAAPVAAAPPEAKGRKSREEIHLELAKLSEQSIEKRKDVEWKVNISFWTAIGLFTWFGVQSVCPMSCGWLCGLFAAYVAVLLVWILGWQIPLHGAYRIDRLFKHYYAEMAEGRSPERPTKEESESTFRSYYRKCGSQPWVWGQVLMTALFLFLSFLVLVQSSGEKKPTLGGDTLNVSGENMKAVIKKLTQ